MFTVNYKARKEAMLAITAAKTVVFKGLYVRERRVCDLDHVKCIKDEENKVLEEEVLIRRRWQTYFHKLLNEEGDKRI
ncbi:hypothetical protein H5410_041711, partial [Solanum commersonii]